MENTWKMKEYESYILCCTKTLFKFPQGNQLVVSFKTHSLIFCFVYLILLLVKAKRTATLGHWCSCY